MTSPEKTLFSSAGINRISSLPESLMVHILSFLRIGDRIKTGVLSRSWRNLWTSVPDLCIKHGIDGPDYQDAFVNFVDETITFIFRSGSRIKSLRVMLPYCDNGYYLPNVGVWIWLAATNGIEEFELDMSSSKYCHLPQYIFRSSSFKELRLLGCKVYPRGPVSWRSLKKLSIRCAQFGDDAIEKILAGTPVLEILELFPLWLFGPWFLYLGNSRVKKLILHLIPHYCSHFKLSAPNLQSLQISGNFRDDSPMRNYEMVNLTSLVEALVIDVRWESCLQRQVDGGLDYPSLVRALVENLLHVETLAFGTMAIELAKGIGMLYQEGLLLKCKSLTIDTHLWGTNPAAIATLLESCPELETLIITMSDHSKHMYSLASPHQLEEGDEFWKSHKLVFDGLKLLRTGKFVNFWDYRAVAFSFAGFLLEKASILQKMSVIIETKGSGQSVTAEERSEATQKLLRMPRSARDAEVVVY